MRRTFLSTFLLCAALVSPAWAVDFRADSVGNGSGTAITVSAPAGTAVGDIVLVHVHVNNPNTIVDNNGSTPFTEDVNDIRSGGGSHTISLFSRRIQSGDPATYAFTQGASSSWKAYAMAISDPHASVIYDSGPVNDCTSGSPNTTAALTTSSDNAFVIQFFAVDKETSVTFSSPPSSPYVQREEDATGPRLISVYSKTKTPAGSESAQTIAYDGVGQFGCGIAVAIEAAAAGGAVGPFRRRHAWLDFLLNPFETALAWLQPQEAYAK